VQAPSLLVSQTPMRHMGGGGQKQLKQRIVAVGNVRKITKAMQMIASSKMRGAERKMQQGRQFAKDMLTVWPDSKKEAAATASSALHKMYVPITSDRGLCGSLNAGVTRTVKRHLEAHLQNKEPFSVFVIGEKGRAHLERQFHPQFTYVATDAGKIKPVTFSEVSLIADHILRQKFDVSTLFYNKFVNSITYLLTPFSVPAMERAMADKDIWQDVEFEGADEELQENLYEFRLAVLLYYFLAENGCSEMSARVSSMSNSSKNAGELADALLLLYNRTRQEKVTTDLLEVISGAMSVDEQNKANSG